MPSPPLLAFHLPCIAFSFRQQKHRSTPAFDIVAACMAYTSKVEEENKVKARKWKNEAGKIADEYKKKTEALILEEQVEVCVFFIFFPNSCL